MNVCPIRLQTLPCGLQGYGYLSTPVRSTDTVLRLMNGHGAFFPALQGGQYFFVTVQGCDGCCETMRVTARDGDVLTVVRTDICDCINSNARVTYDAGSREYIQAIAREIGINTVSPLNYDCETHTLSIDCNKLATDSDCGCGSGTGTAGGGLRGPQGPAGRDGADGVGIERFSIDGNNTLYWTNTVGKTYTIGTLTAPRGEKGEKGDKGDTGPQGPQGPAGTDAGTISMSEVAGVFTLQLTKPDGTNKVIGSWQPVAGVGIEDANVNSDGNLIIDLTNGTQANAGYVIGPRGPVGEVASFGVLYRNGTVYVNGPVGAEFYLRRSGTMLGGRQTIPSGGVAQMANPNTGAEALIEVVHNGGVVALGWF